MTPISCYECLSDEQLLLRARLGLYFCKELLAVRYIRKRTAFPRLACPDYWGILSEGEMNELYFQVYFTAESNFRFGKMRFISYFLMLLQREINKAAIRKMHMEKQFKILSLDSEIPQGGGDVACLRDIIPSNSALDKPEAFLIYAESLMIYGKFPKGVSPKSIDLIHSIKDGYSLDEAAKILGITRLKAKAILAKYRAWARKIYERSNRLLNSDLDPLPDGADV